MNTYHHHCCCCLAVAGLICCSVVFHTVVSFPDAASAPADDQLYIQYAVKLLRIVTYRSLAMSYSETDSLVLLSYYRHYVLAETRANRVYAVMLCGCVLFVQSSKGSTRSLKNLKEGR